LEAEDILKNSDKWLRACEVDRKNGLYSVALYSLEMSVEMALKAVLFKLGIEVPKTHNVAGQIRAVAKENAKIGKEFSGRIDKITDVFSTLVEYRAPSGYSFEYNFSEKELKDKLDGLYAESKSIIELCRKTVRSL
jgi:HEPN domain-containing protein